MPSVIDRQIESLDKSTSEVSASQSNQQVAIVTRELEDLLAMAVALYGRINAGVQRWQASVKDWESDAWVNEARQFETRYRKLLEAFGHIADELARWESDGQRLKGAEEFRKTKLDLDLLCQLSVDRLLKSDESSRQGRGRPMAEVRDELRRRLGA
jgi:hypothetical protein